jgi:hypothetical protein
MKYPIIPAFGLRLAAALLAAGTVLPSASNAQETGRWSATAFGGGYFGTRTFTSPELEVTMASVPTYGLRLGYGVARAFTVEIEWAHASSRLVPTVPGTGASAGPAAQVTVDTYEVDLLYWYGRNPVRGYIGLGGGAMSLDPGVATLSGTASTEFEANVAVGATIRLGGSFFFRADGRYRLRGGRQRVGEIVCYPYGCTDFPTNVFSSAEVTGGVMIRF